jgi:hypothetical protein
MRFAGQDKHESCDQEAAMQHTILTGFPSSKLTPRKPWGAIRQKPTLGLDRRKSDVFDLRPYKLAELENTRVLVVEPGSPQDWATTTRFQSLIRFNLTGIGVSRMTRFSAEKF